MSTEDVIAFKGEVMLAGWSEHHNSSPKVSFFLGSSEDLEPFRDLTVAKGKTAGHRFLMVLVEIGEDERPVNQNRGALTRLAAMFCQQERFRAWAQTQDGWDRAAAVAMSDDPEEIAAEWIRMTCGIKSRRELDTNPAAAKLFHERIRIPYSERP